MGLPSKACPICGTKYADDWLLSGRQCPTCRSLERHRVFAAVYDAHIKNIYDMCKKNILAFHPGECEKRIFRDRMINNIASADIRPEVNTDIVADVCLMTNVATHEYDCVFASYLMTMVYDAESAISEIHRVLKDTGAFISIEPISGLKTREFTDPKVVGAWYGIDTLEKYRVGGHRNLGLHDYESLLKSKFQISTFDSIDPITEKQGFVFLCMK